VLACCMHIYVYSVLYKARRRSFQFYVCLLDDALDTVGLIGCPHIGQPGSRYAAVVCLVIGCIHVTRRVVLCRLFGLPHMHRRLCLAMQKRSSGQALEMRPKSAHLWSQAHAMHSQATAGLARSAMLPRYGNQSGPVSP
jgi:hypothetical protein